MATASAPVIASSTFCCVLKLLLLLISGCNSFLANIHLCYRPSSETASAKGLSSPSLPTGLDYSITIPSFVGETAQGTIYPSPLHFVHVKSILSNTETSRCLEIAKDYAATTGRWDRPDKDRHASYATCDFAVEDCERLDSYLKVIGFHDRIWDQLSERYGVDPEEMTYLDFFCVNYRARSDNDPTSMDRLEAHRDGSLLSYTVLLTPPDQFEGGGTFFVALRDEEPTGPLHHPRGVVRPNRAGDVTMHSGKLLHGADRITSGERTVLVGFVDVAEWRQRPGVLSKACRDWGRMDVATARWKRQKTVTKDGKLRGWFLSNSRWLPDASVKTGKGRSSIRGFCPAFSSVQRRADENYQRRKRLEAEDVMLRTILVPASASEEGLDVEVLGGNVTIL